MRRPACVALGALLAVLGTVVPSVATEGGIIATVVGTGDVGSSGDGGPATGATLWYPSDVAIGPDGDLYVSDSSNHEIRRIDAQSGVITRIAGTGVAGFGGDGGPARNALLQFPRGIAVDPAGNVFVADANNHRVRRIDAVDGTIVTMAGSAVGYAGDGGIATAARLAYPDDVQLGPDGALYVADTYNHCVRRIDAGTGIISTFAGNGSQGFSGDGGPATAAQLSYPYSLAFDAGGRLHVADQGNNRIRRIESSGTITTVAGDGSPVGGGVGVYLSYLPGGWPGEIVGDGGSATSAALSSPSAVAFDAQGRLLVSDSSNFRVRRVEADGTITTVAGSGERYFSGDGGRATQAALHAPFGLAIDRDGNLYIVQSGSHRVRRVTAPF